MAGARLYIGRLLKLAFNGVPLARRLTLTETPNGTPRRIVDIPNMTSPFAGGSIYNGPEKIVIGIDLGTTMSCVLISRTVPDGSSIVLLC